MTVSSLEGFIKRIKDRGEPRAGYTRFYRGQSGDIPLLPRIFREDTLLNNEDAIYIKVIEENSEEFCACQSTFDCLTKMQEMGIATRLLGISTNPLVAFYFACSQAPAEDVRFQPTVYCFDVPNHLLRDSADDCILLVSSLSHMSMSFKENLLRDVASLDAFKELVANEILSLNYDQLMTTIEQYSRGVTIQSLAIYVLIKKRFASNPLCESYSLRQFENNDDEMEQLLRNVLKQLCLSDKHALNVKTTLWNIVLRELDRQVWQIWSPDLLHQVRLEKPSFEDSIDAETFRSIFAVKPKQNDRSMIKQNTHYLIFPDKDVDYCPSIHVTKIEVDELAITSILHDLEMIDISGSSLLL